MKKKWMIATLLVFAFSLATACGNKKQEKVEPTTEEVTEFVESQKNLLFEGIESGINFKASSDKITLSFEDIDKFDNSLEMEICLSDASGNREDMTLSIKEGKSDYTFPGLEKGKEYYLEAYPKKSANSDAEYEKIQKKNAKCKLILK